jgi:hypothetical protein
MRRVAKSSDPKRTKDSPARRESMASEQRRRVQGTEKCSSMRPGRNAVRSKRSFLRFKRDTMGDKAGCSGRGRGERERVKEMVVLLAFAGSLTLPRSSSSESSSSLSVRDGDEDSPPWYEVLQSTTRTSGARFCFWLRLRESVRAAGSRGDGDGEERDRGLASVIKPRGRTGCAQPRLTKTRVKGARLTGVSRLKNLGSQR